MGGAFRKAQHYTRDEIHDVIGGSVEDYLPTRDGHVVCGAFREDANPDAPTIILPGFGKRIESAAKRLQRKQVRYLSS
jgi:hypothetical protein